VRSRSRAETSTEGGSVTAEFAVALPAVVGVLALCLSAVSAVSTHTILTSLAMDSARAWARGETWHEVTSMVARRQPRAIALGTEAAGDFSRAERCVTLSMPMKLGSWIELGITLEEKACALLEL
jgi:hypothetical protein